LQNCCLSIVIYRSVFGWQMAAVKYEKDRAANTLLPNYYEYGRYDVPSYYESYWQSPEERFYIGLFVIQILCLIASFFLLFASVALIYGAHTFSRCLVWPWIPCMLASILSSLAYCIMWWTGDVRDYWLVLTILEMITIFINIYCLFVIIIFYRHMTIEIEFYEEKQQPIYFDDDNRFDKYCNDQRNYPFEDAYSKGFERREKKGLNHFS
uniref:MARVEL domain-containing protein n=1 Tax=Dracunculus medinensis TaxID=318479 RepID=A0A0N4UQJ3_DRAME